MAANSAGPDHLAVSTQWKLLDALDRAWRTFYTLVGVDLLLAIGNGLTQALNEKDVFTASFWQFIVLLIVKSVLAAIASFLLRYVKQPKVPTVGEVPNSPTTGNLG